MPRLPIDYSKTIMYRIICKDPTITGCYVGSTTDFKTRKSQHKYNCNNEKSKEYNSNVYQFIREHNGWYNFNMIEIEKYNAIDKPDQARQERFWLEFYRATLNIIIPSRTKEEYKEQNKDELAEYIKQYREQNKDKIKKQAKGYRKQNKEIIKEHNKEYREQNKEKMYEKMKEKMTCSCGSICRKNAISRHLKTKKHLDYIISLNI